MEQSKYRKLVALNDCVGSFSDEVSWLFKVSSEALSGQGLIFNCSVNGSESSTGENVYSLVTRKSAITSVKSISQFISKEFSVVDIKQDYSKSAINPFDPKPILFNTESLEVAIVRNNKVIKSVKAQVCSKTFHEKLHISISNKNMLAHAFGGLDRIQLDGEFQLRVTLSEPSPVRMACGSFFVNYCEDLIKKYINDNYWRFDSEYNFNKIGNLTFRPRSFIALYDFIRQDFIVPSSSSNRLFDIEIPEDALCKAFDYVSKARELVYSIDEGRGI